MSKILKPEDGYLYDSMADTMRVKLEGVDTGGQYTLIEDTIKPGFAASLQLHRRHSETFYVIEGEITFTIGRQTVKAIPGMTLHVPPNTPHAARSDRAGKMLTLFSPAGLEGALRAFAALTPEEAQDPAVVQALLDEYDIVELEQPPVPALLGFYDALLAGEVESLRMLFTGEPDINTPLQGEVKGAAALARFVAEQQAWLAAREARPEFFNVILSAERIIVEFILYMVQDGGAFDLPVAIAADREGERVSSVRVYHSTWPLTGDHRVRAPIVARPEERLDEPAVVQAYMAGIHEPNKDFVLSLFAGDGYVREPSGSHYKHTGAAGLQQFYGPALEAGGVVLHHCTATFDGHAFGVEYICDEWANVKLPPQAGLAIYELAGPDKIQAARIYDDVLPPFE